MTFTITVHNTSFEAVTLTELTDDVYGNLDGRGSCATGGSIAPGATYTCSFSAVVTSTETDTVTGHVADNEHTSAHDSASATVTVHPAKVTIVKTADAASVAPGGAVGFTVTVHNSGTGIARDVTVSDPLPTDAGLAWVLDDDAGGACHVAAGSVSCGPVDLAPGGSIVFHITSLTTFATADDSPVANRACFATTNAGGSCAAADVVVPQPSRSLTLAKTSDAPLETLLLADGTTVTLPFAHAGTTVKYTLTYSVPAAPVRSVVLTDVLPAGLAYIEGSATDSADGQLMFAGYDAATRTLSWTAATLSTSGSVSYRVTLLKDAAALTQPLTNSARLSSARDRIRSTPRLTSSWRLRRSTRTCCHRPKKSSLQRRPPSRAGSLAGAGSARDPDAGPRVRHPGPGSVPPPEALGRLLSSAGSRGGRAEGSSDRHRSGSGAELRRPAIQSGRLEAVALHQASAWSPRRARWPRMCPDVASRTTNLHRRGAVRRDGQQGRSWNATVRR